MQLSANERKIRGVRRARRRKAVANMRVGRRRQRRRLEVDGRKAIIIERRSGKKEGKRKETRTSSSSRGRYMSGKISGQLYDVRAVWTSVSPSPAPSSRLR